MSGNTSTGGNIGPLSADQWSNLGNFLANIGVAANQRTGGGFLANPSLGAALSQAGVSNQAYQQQTQESRARQALLGAESAQTGMQTALAGTQLPFQQALGQMRLHDLQSSGSPFAPSMPMSPAGSALPSTPSGGLIPMENRQPLLQWASQMPGVTVPPSILGGTIQRESGWDPTATNPQSGAFGLGQTLPSTAQSPGPGMPGTTMDDLKRPENQAYFTARYLSLRGKEVGLNTAADWEDPNNAPKVMEALNGYGGQKQQGPTQYAADILRYAQQYRAPQQTAVTPASYNPPAAPMATSAPPMLSPQQTGGGAGGIPTAGTNPNVARAQAAQLMQMAMHAQQDGYDATPYTQAANSMLQYANQYELQQSQPRTGRGPGSFVVGPNNTVTQAPYEYEVTGPDSREYRITQNAIEDPNQPYVRPPGVPAWAPRGTQTVTMSKLAPGELEGQKESSQDAFGEKSRAQYAAAQGTLRAMEDVQQQYDRLNASGPNWYNTGAGAQWKLQLGKIINGVAASYGGAPIFDADKLASGEDILKQSKIAGMQVLSGAFGGNKEAASIITSTQAAVPNIENTPLGGELVLNGIKEAARWQSDQHTFMSNWYFSHTGNMIGADAAFAQQYPSQKYALRGISQVRPYEIQNESDLKRFLPGTKVYFKGHPEAPGVIGGQQDLVFNAPAPTSAAPGNVGQQ